MPRRKLCDRFQKSYGRWSCKQGGFVPKRAFFDPGPVNSCRIPAHREPLPAPATSWAEQRRTPHFVHAAKFERHRAADVPHPARRRLPALAAMRRATDTEDPVFLREFRLKLGPPASLKALSLGEDSLESVVGMAVGKASNATDRS
jgi:hypothetical protein